MQRSLSESYPNIIGFAKLVNKSLIFTWICIDFS